MRSPHRRRNTVAVMLIFLAIITYLDRVCMSTLGPNIQKDLSLTPTQWGWVIFAFNIAYGLFEVPAGAIGDRWGHRRILSRIVTWWSAFTILTAFTTSFIPLFIVRFLFGAGEAGAFPNLSGCASRWFGATQRARLQGVIWGSSRIGAVLAPVGIKWILDATGEWRVTFWVFGAVGIIWALVWYFWYHDSPGPNNDGPLYPGKSHTPLPWKRLFTSRRLYPLLFMYFFYAWGANFYLSNLPNYLQLGRGMSQDEALRFLKWPFLAGVITCPLGGYISDRLTRLFGFRFGRRILGSSCLFLTAGQLFLITHTTDRLTMQILIVTAFATLDLMLASAWAVSMDLGGRYAGAISGAMNMFGNIGGGLSAVLFGVVVERSGGYERPLQVVGVALIIAATSFLIVDPSRPLLDEDAEFGRVQPPEGTEEATG